MAELRPADRQLVRELVEFLLLRSRQQAGRQHLRQDWAGALRAYRDQYTSLELEREALAWRDNP
jgi:hypothetical protein